MGPLGQGVRGAGGAPTPVNQSLICFAAGVSSRLHPRREQCRRSGLRRPCAFSAATSARSAATSAFSASNSSRRIRSKSAPCGRPGAEGGLGLFAGGLRQARRRRWQLGELVQKADFGSASAPYMGNEGESEGLVGLRHRRVASRAARVSRLGPAVSRFRPGRLDLPGLQPGIVQLGPFALRWYALAYIAGILLGWRYWRAAWCATRSSGARGRRRVTGRRSTT